LYIDIIIFAVLAGVLAANLFRILGKKTDVSDLVSKTTDINQYKEDKVIIDIDRNKLNKIDKDFDYASFIEGAKAAFNLIVSSYKMDKLENVKDLVSPAVYSAFKNSMNDDVNNDTPENTFKITSLKAAIINVEIIKKLARIKVEFLSRQDYKNNDEEKQEIKDIWTFEKEISNQNPNWLLIEVNSE
tara:strand:- start:104 stop:664 length:561 start_codon:yes stop_codon:yes gene_type:complete